MTRTLEGHASSSGQAKKKLKLRGKFTNQSARGLPLMLCSTCSYSSGANSLTLAHKSFAQKVTSGDNDDDDDDDDANNKRNRQLTPYSLQESVVIVVVVVVVGRITITARSCVCVCDKNLKLA